MPGARTLVSVAVLLCLPAAAATIDFRNAVIVIAPDASVNGRGCQVSEVCLVRPYPNEPRPSPSGAMAQQYTMVQP